MILRLVAAAILGSAALAKLVDFEKTQLIIERLGWFPELMHRPLADLLLFSEIAAPVLLLHPRLWRSGSFLTLLLASAFTLVTWSRLAQGVDDSCECFGVLLPLSPRITLAIDLVLIAIGTYLIAHSIRTARLRPLEFPYEPSRDTASS